MTLSRKLPRESLWNASSSIGPTHGELWSPLLSCCGTPSMTSGTRPLLGRRPKFHCFLIVLPDPSLYLNWTTVPECLPSVPSTSSSFPGLSSRTVLYSHIAIVILLSTIRTIYTYAYSAYRSSYVSLMLPRRSTVIFPRTSPESRILYPRCPLFVCSFPDDQPISQCQSRANGKETCSSFQARPIICDHEQHRGRW